MYNFGFDIKNGLNSKQIIMKKFFLLCTTVIIFSVMQAQQGVAINTDGSNADNSALLDIKSSSKGILIPRVTSAQKTGIASPATGLLVYQTDGTAGFYYFNGNSWSPLSGVAQGPLSGWATTGNTGTDSSVNYIGTADNNPLVGKVNGEQVFRFSPGVPNTSVGYQAGKNNTGSYNHFIGYRAGLSNTTGIANFFQGYEAGFSNTTANYNHFSGFKAGHSDSTGIANHFEGFYAGYSNTTGSQNYFSGQQAGYANTTASQNHFVGYQAGFNNTIGENNYFAGFGAGSYNTTGSNNHFEGYKAGYSNTAGLSNTFIGNQSGYSNSNGFANNFIGFKSGYSNTSGTQNTYIGFQSGFANNGSGNVFIGYQAGAQETAASNKLIISNSQTSNPLIYGAFDSNLVRFNGTTVMNGIAQVEGVASINGTANIKGGTNINGYLSVVHYSNAENKVAEVKQVLDNVYAKIYFENSNHAGWEVGGVGTGTNSTSFFEFTYLGTNALKMDGLGHVTIASTLTQNSDIRLKKNLTPLTNVLGKIISISGYTYNWIDARRDTSEQIGFIAQEVEKEYPQLVKTDEHGIKSVAYGNMTPILLEAIKEQQQQIDELKKAIEDLKKR
jgi:endosialidase-like protein